MSSLRRLDPIIKLTSIIWLVVMITTPIIKWIGGEGSHILMIYLVVISQALVTLAVIWIDNPSFSGCLPILFILPLAWFVEVIGSRTGFPFGSYSYTERLQPQLLHVPLLVPLAWLMMLPPAWGISAMITASLSFHSRMLRRLVRSSVAAMAFTAWDLFLDPQMVAWDFWRWLEPGSYYGIPLTNFGGWFFSSFILSYLLTPSHLPQIPLAVIYIITWFLQSVAMIFFWRLPFPGICGFLGMGGMVLWVLLKRDTWPPMEST